MNDGEQNSGYWLASWMLFESDGAIYETTTHGVIKHHAPSVPLPKHRGSCAGTN